jgi:hypothetical protein
MHNPDAFFDTLAVIGELDVPLNGVSRLEVQRAAYLACLLALYDGHPLSDWGHRFARTEFGTPFSAGVNDALDTLADAGHLIEHKGRFSLSASGQVLLETLSGMASMIERRRFLTAACGSALIVPPATFSQSLDNEPTLRRALQRERGGGLLDGPALTLLYEQFEALARVVERRTDDLLTPSVVWLSYMADQPVTRQTHGADR